MKSNLEIDLTSGMYSTSENNRERRARTALRSLSCTLEKVPARSWIRAYYGVGYMVLDWRNNVVLGCGSRCYMATLAEVEEFIAIYREKHSR
jgi:hypothetical protein